MNILMVIPDFGKGGAERVFSQLGAELAKEHRVIDCVFNRLLNREYHSGNETVDLEVPAGSNVFSKIFYFCLRIYRLRQIKKQYSIDLTISHLEGADYVNLLSRRNDQVIVCIHGTKIHDTNISGAVGWFRLKVLIPMLYKRAARIVTVSHAIKHELTGCFRLPDERITVINNFFDVEAIQEKAQERLKCEYQRLMDDNDVIITSGRLSDQKNQRLVIQLMPGLLSRRPGLKLIILGSGELKNFLMAEAVKNGLRVQAEGEPFQACNDVFFPGFCRNPFPYYRAAKIFVLPSLWEGFPLVLCEALICQAPVIAHDCPTGPREIIAPHLQSTGKLNAVTYTDYGVLMPFSYDNDQETIDRWIGAILKILGDEIMRNRFAVNGKKRTAVFNKEDIVQQWLQLINTY